MKQLTVFSLCVVLFFNSRAQTAPDLSRSAGRQEQLNALARYCDSLKAGGFGAAAGIISRNKALLTTGFQGLALVPAGDLPDSARFTAYVAYAYSHRMDLQTDSVLYYYNKSLQLALAAKSAPLIANACGSLLHIEFEMQSPDKVETHRQLLLSILDTTSDATILRDGYSTLGNYYQHKAYYSTAQDYYLKSIAIRKQQLASASDPKSKLDYATQCYLLAQLYHNAGLYDKELPVLYEGSRFKGLSGLTDYRFVSSFVTVFCKTGQIDSALYYLHHRVDSLELKLKGRPPMPAEVVLPNLAVAQYYLAHQQYDKAGPILDKADSLTSGKQFSFLVYDVQRLKAKYYLQTGRAARAIPVLLGVLPSLQQISRENYTEALKDLATAYEATGNGAEALHYFKAHVESLDSLTNERISRNFADQETRYQTTEKEAQIVVLNKDNQLKVLQLKTGRQTRTALILGLVILGLFSLALYFFYRKLARINLRLAEANDTKAKLFGIIGHDLRAPVSNIIQLLTIQQRRPELLDGNARRLQEEKIRDSSARLLETMEDLLFWSKTQLQNFAPQAFPVAAGPAVQKELEFLSPLSSDKRLAVDLHIPSGLSWHTDETFLSIILRNLLQNAFKYSPTGSTIRVSADSRSISITNPPIGRGVAGGVADTGSRAAGDIRTAGDGLGLQIAGDLAAAIHADLSFREEPGVWTVTLAFRRF